MADAPNDRGVPAKTFAEVLREERAAIFGDPCRGVYDAADVMRAGGVPPLLEEHAKAPPAAAAAGDDVTEASVFDAAHRTTPARALCLSGGGIRSATFNLGLMQGLARGGYLSTFDYLSTVSGGGFAGAWLSAWTHRAAGGIEAVEKAVAKGMSSNPASDHDPARPLLKQEPDEIRYLREFSNYLTPRLGWFSADTWTLLATYPRNLLLNWLVILPVVGSIVCLVWLLLGMAVSVETWTDESAFRVGAAGILHTGRYLLATGICLAFPVMLVRETARLGRTGDERRGLERGLPWAAVIWPIYVGSVLMTIALLSKGVDPQNDWRTFTFVNVVSTMVEFLKLAVLASGIAFVTLLYQRFRLRPSALTVVNWYAWLLAAYVTAAASGVLVYFGGLNWLARSGVADNPVLMLWLDPVLRVLSVFWCLTIIIGLMREDTSPDGEAAREWWGRLMGHLLRLSCLHLIVIGVAAASPLWLHRVPGALMTVKVSTVFTVVTSLLIGQSSSTGGTTESTPVWRRWLNRYLPGTVAAAALLMLAALAALTFVYAADRSGVWPGLFAFDEHGQPVPIRKATLAEHFDVWKTGGLCAGLLLFGVMLSWPININRFSLFGTYRMRLMRAFLGASRGRARVPDGFTGFDGHDNVPLHHLLRRAGLTVDEIEPRVLAKAMMQVPERLFKAIWQDRLDDLTDGRSLLLALADSPWGQPLPPQLATLPQRMVATLNAAADDPFLLQAAYGQADDPSGAALGRVQSRAIREAYALVTAGQSPRLCNRLILEDRLRATYDHAGEAVTICALPRKANKPFHVVNMALNLVGDQPLAWQQRKARSFTMTPLACGYGDAYRSSIEYGNGMSLGGAMTISGAAASPNMGYHSSPTITALLSLFNVRLGCWLGNTADEAQTLTYELRRRLKFFRMFAPIETFRLQSPRFALRPMLDELFGRTTQANGYVYLSDGGHFENLGLYEMVRRRCKLIVVSDASCDPKSDMHDLANAVRKIRIDLGISIRMHRVRFRLKDDDDKTVRYCTVGEILYNKTDVLSGGGQPMKGLLIYFKPTLTGREPVDIYNYQRQSSAFPHESTADQWFTESQFESYRRLGERAAETVLGVLTDPADPARVRELLSDLDWIRGRADKYRTTGERSCDFPEAVGA